jgi:regulatory protein
VEIDGRYFGTFSDVLLYQERIVVGLTLDSPTLERLRESADRQAVLDATLNYLSFRPRSASELNRYVERRTTDLQARRWVLGELQRLNLVDDEAFARFWTENRDRFRPRGTRLIQAELRQKGIGRETIEAVTQESTDESQELLAMRAATPYVRRLGGASGMEFRRKLGSYLVRRGFDYDTVSTVIKRLWDEAHGEEHRS